MNSWPTKKMFQVTRLITDGKHGDCEDDANSGYFFLSSKDLRDGKLYYDDSRQITHTDFLETHRRTDLEPGDILLTNCGASIGRVGIAQDDPRIYRTTFQKSISVIKPDKALVEGRYLYYFLLANSALLIHLGDGTAQPNLLIGDLKRIDVSMPPRPVQQRMVTILSAYDELVENCKRRIRLLEAVASALYREWFVELRFPGKQRSNFTASPLGPIPEGWEVRKVAEFADFERGFEPGSNAYCKQPAPNLIRFLRVGDLSKRDSEVYIPIDLTEGRTLKPSDIAITLDGSVGLVRLGLAGAYSTGIRKIVVRDQSRLGWSFAYQLLSSDSIQATIQAHAKGTTIKHAGSAIAALEFVAPPPAVIEWFEHATAPMLKQVLTLRECIQNLSRTRDLMLPQLLSGDVETASE